MSAHLLATQRTNERNEARSNQYQRANKFYTCVNRDVQYKVIHI